MSLNTGTLLATRRRSKRISQLDLSFRLGISQRHLGFVETGRARPGRDLLISWLAELRFETSEANAILLRMGYPPNELGRSPQEIAEADEGMRRILLAHEPYPAFLFGADWHIEHFNSGVDWLAGLLLPDVWPQARAGAPMDMILAMIAPGGLISQMENPMPVALAIQRRLHAEAVLRPDLAGRITVLDAWLKDRMGPNTAPVADLDTSLSLSFLTAFGRLSFITAQFLSGPPQNAHADSLRMEVWFPMDHATKAVMTTHVRPREPRAVRASAAPILMPVAGKAS